MKDVRGRPEKKGEIKKKETKEGGKKKERMVKKNEGRRKSEREGGK